MRELDAFLTLHRELVMLRGECIADYWEENRSDDLLRVLSLRQMCTLLAIEQIAPCSLAGVMARTNLSKSAASAAVDKLVRCGMVTRRRNEENRRELIIEVEPEIRHYLDSIEDRFHREIDRHLAACGASEIHALNEASRALLNQLHPTESDVRK